MVKRWVENLFYSNLFIGFLAITISISTTKQLFKNYNELPFYIFIGCFTVLFYLFAYRVPKGILYSKNIRTTYFIRNRELIKTFKIILLTGLFFSSPFLVYKLSSNLYLFKIPYLLIIIFTILICSNYYNWKLGLHLRNIMWLKPFLIGWGWAIIAVFFPMLVYSISNGNAVIFSENFYYLFYQIFILFFINSIIFDIKDLEDDRINNINTYVVKYGYTKTLNFLIIPILFFASLSFVIITFLFNFSSVSLLINTTILFLFLLLSIKLRNKKPMLYFLIFIDGIILLKAILEIILL